MTRVSAGRSGRPNERIASFVKTIVEEPVKEAVREALAEEERTPGASSAKRDDDSSSLVLRIVLVLGALAAISYAARRWRSSSEDELSAVPESTAPGSRTQGDRARRVNDGIDDPQPRSGDIGGDAIPRNEGSTDEESADDELPAGETEG